MIKYQSVHFSIPIDFQNIYEDFIKNIRNYEPFKELLKSIKTKDGKVDKRVKKDKIDSRAIRYAIVFFNNHMRKQELLKLKNAQT